MNRLDETTPPESPTPEDADPSLDDAFADIRRVAGIDLAQMGAAIHAKLFSVPLEPVRMGRYVIIDRLGQGGMGVVYRAYDPKLDRRVAIKLIRSGIGGASERARQRFDREARALARLAHPNIVPVHDVGEIDDQVFIVMGFVEGQTLRAWAREEPRSWRDIVEAYLDAARGLDAAHRVALVHRDFKPDNVLVSRDGRVQVLDFGLARSLGAPDPDASPEGSPEGSAAGQAEALSDAELAAPPPADRARATWPGTDSQAPATDGITATGAIIGTPAYMSPEQHAGAQVAAASDQFSFCVSLYEALYGQRPFAGETAGDIRHNVLQGAIRPAPRTAASPTWLEPILRRGLQPDPSDRFPSMVELIAALSHDRGRARRRWATAAMLAALIGLSAYIMIGIRSPGPAVCQGAERALADTWNPERRTAIAGALENTGQAYARLAGPRAVGQIDAYADAWVDMHENACLAHHQGQQSGTLLDLRMACLERRQTALAAALEVVGETEDTSPDRTIEVISNLPSIAYCADAEALLAEVPLPESPTVAAAVRDLATKLARARALEHAGRYAAALELLDQLDSEAAEVDYRPLLAELALVRGRLTLASGRREDALQPLRTAAALGLSTGRFDVALEAIARQIYVEGTWAEFRGDPLATLDVALALMPHNPAPTFSHTLLLNNAGVVHMGRGQRQRAREHFVQARAVRDAGDGSYIELAIVDFNQGLVTEDRDERLALMRRTASAYDRLLGVEHPRALEYRRAVVAHVRNPVHAQSELAPICRALARYHPGQRDTLGRCWQKLGAIALELGDRAAAAEHLQAAAEDFDAAGRPIPAHLTRGLGLFHAGRGAQATTELLAGQQRLRAEPDKWWNRMLLAEFDLTLGAIAHTSGERNPSITALEQALAGFRAAAAHSRSAQLAWHTAAARTTLASALWPESAKTATTDAQRARAARLIDCAEAVYRREGEGFDHRLQQLAQWRSARGLADGSPGRIDGCD